MNLSKLLLFLTLLLSIISCSTTYEVTMPYKNLEGYSGNNIFPVKTNDAEFTFKAWVSNNTSIDRIISISKDSGADYIGTLFEIGKTFKEKRFVNYYNEISLIPKSGFANFVQKLDSLRALTIINQPCCIDIPYDSPLSKYVIEIKNKHLYNCFKFYTNYPVKSETLDLYTTIEKLLFYEFSLSKYFKFKQNESDI